MLSIKLTIAAILEYLFSSTGYPSGCFAVLASYLNVLVVICSTSELRSIPPVPEIERLVEFHPQSNILTSNSNVVIITNTNTIHWYLSQCFIVYAFTFINGVVS
jgi:hypothetical protein